ncbi:hypothetical protein HPB48_000678 [Haemaphysalis longicornis]|uniref:Uncharacterized protein n=1 Tax=Haemaphysalis longicornis TaxID=44386 RepID=A0A9J6GZE6_HAELO|nr:hypothetical protein HPB48_000678 [Haemaphysalis longicornis]
MSATGNAAGNASVNASISATESGAEKRAQQEEQEEGAAPPPAVIVHPEHEDADLMPSQYLVRLIKHASPCRAVRKRQDIIDRDDYYNWMRMTNAEQHELRSRSPTSRRRRQHLRYGSSSPDRLVVARHSSFGLPWISRTGTATPVTTPPTTRSSSAPAPERWLWQWEEPRCTRLSSSLGRPQAPTRTEAQGQRVERLPRGLPQREMRHHKRGEHDVCKQLQRSRLEWTPWLLRILLRVPLREEVNFFLRHGATVLLCHCATFNK